MKKIVRLTESDLVRLVKRVINEQSNVCNKQIFYKVIRGQATNLETFKKPDGSTQKVNNPTNNFLEVMKGTQVMFEIGPERTEYEFNYFGDSPSIKINCNNLMNHAKLYKKNYTRNTGTFR